MKRSQVEARRQGERRAAARHREDLRELDHRARGGGLVFSLFLMALLGLVSMLRCVPIVEHSEAVWGDVLDQEMQVSSRWPV